jgi:hypothetical protein
MPEIAEFGTDASALVNELAEIRPPVGVVRESCSQLDTARHRRRPGRPHPDTVAKRGPGGGAVKGTRGRTVRGTVRGTRGGADGGAQGRTVSNARRAIRTSAIGNRPGRGATGRIMCVVSTLAPDMPACHVPPLAHIFTLISPYRARFPQKEVSSHPHLGWRHPGENKRRPAHRMIGHAARPHHAARCGLGRAGSIRSPPTRGNGRTASGAPAPA